MVASDAACWPAASCPRQAEVTIPAHPNLRSVPRSFLGISTEYRTLPVWASHISLLDRVLSVVRVNGPLVLRIRGNSADHAFWAPVRELPEWIFELTPSWLSQVSAIARRSGVRLVLNPDSPGPQPADGHAVERSPMGAHGREQTAERGASSRLRSATNPTSTVARRGRTPLQAGAAPEPSRATSRPPATRRPSAPTPGR